MDKSGNKPVGLMGGTFNPVHFGHLRPLIEFAEAFDLHQVALLPCRQPAHRDQPRVPVEHRLAMLQLAVRDCPRLAVDERELLRQGPSYTIDTLKEIRKENGEETPIYFALGGDAFDTIEQWKDWQALLDFSNLVVLRRLGSSPFSKAHRLMDRLRHFSGNYTPCGWVHELLVSQLAISSTAIRQARAKDAAIDFLLPKAVQAYIEQHQLYSGNYES